MKHPYTHRLLVPPPREVRYEEPERPWWLKDFGRLDNAWIMLGVPLLCLVAVALR